MVQQVELFPTLIFVFLSSFSSFSIHNWREKRERERERERERVRVRETQRERERESRTIRIVLVSK